MKLQELNQQELQTINGGSSLLGLGILEDLLGLGNNNNDRNNDDHESSGNGNRDRNSGSSGLPIIGDLGLL